MKKVNWGFIGCGKVVQKKSGAAFNNVPNSRVYAIRRRNYEDALKSAKMFHADKAFQSIDELLKSDIDAVYIATPPGLHYEQAMACCRACKPVYLEKPFARNYTEAYKITQAFKEAGIPLYVGHYRREQLRFKFIKKQIDLGRIGKIFSVDFQLNRIFSDYEKTNTWLYNPILSGGGKFYDIAPHALDIIAFLFGNLVDVEGYAINNGTACPLEDTVVMAFKTEKNILGTANFNLIANEKADRMIVKGTNGIMQFSIHGKSDVIIENSDTGESEIYNFSEPECVEQAMIDSVVKDILGIGTCVSKAIDVLPTYKVIDKVLSELYKGREDDFWNHPERWKEIDANFKYI